MGKKYEKKKHAYYFMWQLSGNWKGASIPGTGGTQSSGTEGKWPAGTFIQADGWFLGDNLSGPGVFRGIPKAKSRKKLFFIEASAFPISHRWKYIYLKIKIYLLL